MVRLLADGMLSTVIAGDPDQSVFGFRGADPYEFTHIADGEACLEWRDSWALDAVTGAIS